MAEVKEKKHLSPRRLLILFLLGLAAAALIYLVLSITVDLVQNKHRSAEIQTRSALQEIVNVSELSTYTAVYNGVAVKYNEKKPEDVDYYVAYEASIKAGIDFSAIDISIDRGEKLVRISLPPVAITGSDVDIGSLEFIFENKKAETETVTQEAQRLCREDVEREGAMQQAILELARQNAKTVIEALTTPYLELFYPGYEPEIVFSEAAP